jgi:uncharacterized OB-fold protein
LTEQQGLLVPIPDEDSAEFWEGCRAGELRMQSCASCGKLRFPPRPMCPSCRSLESSWVALSGRGTIWSFVVAHPPLLPAYAALAPYNCVVVSTDEDPTIRLVGNLVAGPDQPINSVDPSTIEIGQRVKVVFQRLDEEFVLPRWMRA